MQKIMDEVSFHNMGREGKETHLIKYSTAKTIQDYMANSELDSMKKERGGESAPRTPVSYTVRLMNLSEAVEVSRCAFMAYGYTYTNEDIYYPDRIRQRNETEKVISLLAVTDDGEIIGHAALVMNDYDNTIAEAAMGFVKPQYRGQGCLNSLINALPGEARNRNLVGVSGEATAVHLYSQKASLKMGLRDCALLLSKMPPAVYRDIQSDDSQRRSYVYCFRYIQAPEQLDLFPPSHHRDMIEKLYANIGITPHINSPRETENPLLQNDATIKFTTNCYMTAKIEVISYGKNVIDDVGRILKRLCAERLETIYLYLNLADPCTAFMTSAFEKLGFFFSGVLPGSSGKNRLLLQYLNNQALNYENLHIASDIGQELLNCIKERDPYQNIV